MTNSRRWWIRSQLLQLSHRERYLFFFVFASFFFSAAGAGRASPPVGVPGWITRRTQIALQPVGLENRLPRHDGACHRVRNYRPCLVERTV